MKACLILLSLGASVLIGCGSQTTPDTQPQSDRQMVIQAYSGPDGESSADVPPELGSPVEIPSLGTYNSESSERLLEDLKVDSWADDFLIETELLYYSNGSLARSKIEAPLTHKTNNTYSAKANYPAVISGYVCFVPIELEFKFYQHGFLVRNHQPQYTALQSGYCLHYQYRWYHEKEPYRS